MKTVIFKKFGDYYTTPEENYYARIENARLTHRYGHASSADASRAGTETEPCTTHGQRTRCLD